MSAKPSSSAQPDTNGQCVVAQNLHAAYGEGELRVPVLEGASFAIPRGSIAAITGPSGSGKTTLLSLMGGLDIPDQGSLKVDDTELTTLSRRALNRFRRMRIGFVFQAFNLLPTLNARENVETALEPLGMARSEIRSRSEGVLAAVGLGEKLHRFPHELSGGEQQRVAVARACCKAPPLILADEPTGNLDEDAGERVLDLLLGELTCGEEPRTVVIVTHDPSVAARADTVLTLSHHRIVEQTSS